MISYCPLHTLSTTYNGNQHNFEQVQRNKAYKTNKHNLRNQNKDQTSKMEFIKLECLKCKDVYVRQTGKSLVN